MPDHPEDMFGRVSPTSATTEAGPKPLFKGSVVLRCFALFRPEVVLEVQGAEVIKVEPPLTGDPLRVWRELDVDGTSPWFRSLGRNKKSVTIDLRKDEGRA